MKKKRVFIIVALVAVIVFTVAVLALNKSDDTKTETAQSAATISQPQSEPKKDPDAASANPDSPVSNVSVASGRYTAFGGAKLSEEGYDTNVIFFFAPWCPECRAFKEAIQSDSIPDGVQILEADYDSSTELKKQYGVTLQSTFVRVDDSGTLQKKWVGYGKDKSLQTILTNLN